MKIGGLELKNGLLLAPMAGITDSVFRGLCAEQGAELTFTEMISAKGLMYENRSTENLLSRQYDSAPCAVQLFGSDPDVLAEQVKNPLLRGFAAIDLNMGCPARKIVSNGDGSALMEKPELAFALMRAAVRNASVPVTVKIRAGADARHLNAPQIARLAEEAGVSAITVHGRTREQGYGGRADRAWIREVCEAVNLPVIGNGDVRDGESARAMLAQTGCAAVMVGRAAFGNPWVFGEITGALAGKPWRPPTLRERGETVLRHAQALCALKGEETAVQQMRKHLCAYTRGLPGAGRMRARLQAVASLPEIQGITEEIFFAPDPPKGE